MPFEIISCMKIIFYGNKFLEKKVFLRFFSKFEGVVKYAK